MRRTETITVVFSNLVASIYAYEVRRQEHFTACRAADAAEQISAALAETEQLDVPAEAAKLRRLRERLSRAGM